MENLTKLMHNVETDEINLIELSDEETAQIIADRKAFAENKAKAKAEAQKKREASLAKLAGLGLEPDDLKALGL